MEFTVCVFFSATTIWSCFKSQLRKEEEDDGVERNDSVVEVYRPHPLLFPRRDSQPALYVWVWVFEFCGGGDDEGSFLKRTIPIIIKVHHYFRLTSMMGPFQSQSVDTKTRLIRSSRMRMRAYLQHTHWLSHMLRSSARQHDKSPGPRNKVDVIVLGLLSDSSLC